MDAQDFRSLQEAYNQVHQPQEEVEQFDENIQDAAKGALSAGAKFMKTNSVGKAIGGVLSPVGSGRKTPTKASGGYRPIVKSVANEETDLYDTILGYLVAEGYAETNEAALAIMANMSEGWKQSIVEGVGGYDDPVAGPHTPIGKAVRSGLKTAGNVATKVVNRTVPPNIRSAVANKAQEITSGRY